jgi:hypothetical protein
MVRSVGELLGSTNLIKMSNIPHLHFMDAISGCLLSGANLQFHDLAKIRKATDRRDLFISSLVTVI